MSPHVVCPNRHKFTLVEFVCIFAVLCFHFACHTLSPTIQGCFSKTHVKTHVPLLEKCWLRIIDCLVLFSRHFEIKALLQVELLLSNHINERFLFRTIVRYHMQYPHTMILTRTYLMVKWHWGLNRGPLWHFSAPSESPLLQCTLLSETIWKSSQTRPIRKVMFGQFFCLEKLPQAMKQWANLSGNQSWEI